MYFANSRLGFASRAVNNYLRTTNSGDSWTIINGPNIWFNDIQFIDSLNGYKANGYMMKTTDGGLNWMQQILPPINDTLSLSQILRFSKESKDTIYGVGAIAFMGLRHKGIVLKTTNGGDTWGYQLPDTNIIKFQQYYFISFIDAKTGWAYQPIAGGIYTNVGGDYTNYVNVFSTSEEIPVDYKLHQNYPNPFNPVTRISFDIRKTSDVKLDVYDITGKHIDNIVNQRQQPGSYAVDFDSRFHGGASGLSSGIYFCILKAGSNFVSNIKMIFLK